MTDRQLDVFRFARRLLFAWDCLDNEAYLDLHGIAGDDLQLALEEIEMIRHGNDPYANLRA